MLSIFKNEVEEEKVMVEFLDAIKPKIKRMRREFGTTPKEMCALIKRFDGIKIPTSTVNKYFEQLDKENIEMDSEEFGGVGMNLSKGM